MATPGGAIVHALEEVGSKVAQSPALKDATDAVVGGISQGLMSMRSNLSNSPGGRGLLNFVEKGIEPKVSKLTQQLAQPTVNYMNQGQGVHGPMRPAWQLKIQAKNMARAQVGGNHDQVISGWINLIERTEGHEKAQYAMDAMGTYFSEEPTPDIKVRGTKASAAGASSNTLVKNMSKNPGTKDLLFTNSPYKSPGGKSGILERGVMSFTSAALAPKSAILHLSQQLNLPLDQGVISYLKAIKEIMPVIGDYKAAKLQLEHAGVAGILAHDEYSAIYSRRYGAASYLPKGRIGDFIAKNFSVPLMPAIKEFNMVVAGMQGKYRAAEIADTLQAQTSGGKFRAAVSDARTMGLDWQRLQSNGLSQADIETAMYHNINNTIFTNSRLNRNIYALTSPQGRMISMYHNFALQQGNFIYNNLKRTIMEKHDPVSVVRTLALFGVVAPAVGEGLEEFRKLATGRDWDDPLGHYQKRMEDFYSMRDFDQKLLAMAHIAGFGYFIPYIRATARYKLATAVAGPVFNTGFELAEDVAKGVQGTTDRRWYPLMRDVLHDIPSMGVGAAVSNIFLPPQDPHMKKPHGRSVRRIRRR